MGLFGAIWSGIKAVGSGISSCVKAIGSGIKSAAKVCSGVVSGAIKGLSKLGGVIKDLGVKAVGFLGGVTKALAPILSPILGPYAPIITDIIITVVSNLVGNLLEKRGEPKMEEEEMEEYGYLLEQSDSHPEWKRADEFESGKEHYQYLRDAAKNAGIEDMPKVPRFSPESLTRKSLSMAAMADRLAHKEGIGLPAEFLVKAGLKFLSVEEWEAIIVAAKSLGYKTVPYAEFVENKLPLEEMEKFKEAIRKQLIAIKEEKGETLSVSESFDAIDAIHSEPTEDSVALNSAEYLEAIEAEGEKTPLYDVEGLKVFYEKHGMQEELNDLNQSIQKDKLEEGNKTSL
jgi:hypothetical protein